MPTLDEGDIKVGSDYEILLNGKCIDLGECLENTVKPVWGWFESFEGDMQFENLHALPKSLVITDRDGKKTLFWSRSLQVYNKGECPGLKYGGKKCKSRRMRKNKKSKTIRKRRHKH